MRSPSTSTSPPTADLSDEDLPLAAGGDSPGIVQREGEFGVGIRDLNQLFIFGQAAGQAVDPQGFADFETAKKQIEQRLGRLRRR